MLEASRSVPQGVLQQNHVLPSVTPITHNSSIPIRARYLPDSEDSKHIDCVLMILALVFASISVMSTLTTLYWFVKMRRSFRHELILLLVQSDLVKSLAFVVFPIVTLVSGTVHSDSAFCQVSGFILAIGIESSDIAILLIALHSVMYIFRPKSGLYRYRHLASLVFYLFPVTTACLAFINGPGYENVGHYCYLRTDSSWSRLALSWVPRYFICLSIVGIYAFIYIYIRKRMDDYGRRSSGSLEPSPQPIGAEPVTPSCVPRIIYHGLIPSTPTSQRTSAAETTTPTKDRQASASSASTVQFEIAGDKTLEAPPIISISPPSHRRPSVSRQQQHRRSIHWSWDGFDQPPTSSRTRNIVPEETQDPLSIEGPVIAPISPPPPVARRKSQATSTSGDRSEACSSAPASPSQYYNRPVPSICPTHPESMDATYNSHFLTTTTRWHQPAQKRSFSLPNIFTILRRGPSMAASSYLSAPQYTLHSASAGDDLAAAGGRGAGGEAPLRFTLSAFEDNSGSVSRHRDKIRRQLRNLFVYPLVYMIIWTFPFVSHVMGYDDSVKRNDPQWLLVLGILSLSVQGMVDCLLFAVREQPWRHARGRRFWASLKKRWGLFGGSSIGLGLGRGTGLSGRTREEMLVDGRLARERRAEEVASERERRNNINMNNNIDSFMGRHEPHEGGGGRLQRGEDNQDRRLGSGAREWWDSEAFALDFGDDYDDDDDVEEEQGGNGDAEDGGVWMSAPHGSS